MTHLLSFPKHFYNLRSKYSNLWAYGILSHSRNHHLIPFCGQGYKMEWITPKKFNSMQLLEAVTFKKPGVCFLLSYPIWLSLSDQFLCWLTGSINQFGWEIFWQVDMRKKSREMLYVIPKAPSLRHEVTGSLQTHNSSRKSQKQKPDFPQCCLSRRTHPEHLVNSNLSLLQFLLSSTWRHTPQEARIS